MLGRQESTTSSSTSSNATQEKLSEYDKDTIKNMYKSWMKTRCGD
jgi:hypothetical protein